MLHSVFVSVCLCRRQWRGGGGGGEILFLPFHSFGVLWCFVGFGPKIMGGPPLDPPLVED